MINTLTYLLKGITQLSASASFQSKEKNCRLVISRTAETTPTYFHVATWCKETRPACLKKCLKLLQKY
jgi:hypothetical protein